MKTILLLITILAFFGCDSKDKFLVTCDKWTHPSSKGELIPANPGSSYKLGQVLSVNLTPVDPKVEPAWDKEALDEAGYTGNNVGFIKVNVPEDGDYIVWSTVKTFITYINSEGNAQLGAEYIANCTQQLEQGGYLKAVTFSFKAGVNEIQLSHSTDKSAILTVSKAQ